MKRFLKKYFGRVLPESLRASVKRRALAKFSAPVEGDFIVEETGAALRCKIDNQLEFVAPLACKDQLLHFTTTADGRAEFSSVARAARSGGVLFDIGAHSGIVSALFCAAHPQNRAFTFEPSPVLSERLLEIQRLNGLQGRMQIEQVAIGDAAEEVEMLLDPASGFVQVQRFEHTMWAAPQRILVPIERIPDAAARLRVVPHFIKLDVEGYEYEAVAGIIGFLREHKPTIFLELHLNYLEQRNLSAHSVVDMLVRCAYRFYTSSGSPIAAKQLYDSPLPSLHVVAV